MHNKTFANTMDRIAAEATAEQQREEAAQRRRQFYSRVHGGILSLIGIGALAAGVFYRAELQQFVSEKVLTNEQQVGDGTGETLKEVQTQAAKRDEVLDEIIAPK